MEILLLFVMDLLMVLALFLRYFLVIFIIINGLLLDCEETLVLR